MKDKSKNKIDIRLAQKIDCYDLPTLCDETDLWHAHIMNITNNLLRCDEKECRCYIALLDDMMIGFVYGHVIDNQVLYPQFMYVKREKRKYGIGKLLMHKLEVESGCPISMIYYNKSLHDYYTNQGYSTASELETAIKKL